MLDCSFITNYVGELKEHRLEGSEEASKISQCVGSHAASYGHIRCHMPLAYTLSAQPLEGGFIALLFCLRVEDLQDVNRAPVAHSKLQPEHTVLPRDDNGRSEEPV